MVVYYELVFVDNFIINFLLLLFSSKYYANKTKILRLVFVAVFGGIYATCSLLENLIFLRCIPIKIAAALLICFLAFGYKSLSRFIKVSVSFFSISFLFAGVLYAFLHQSELSFSSKGIIYCGKFLRYMLYGIFTILLTYRLYIFMHKSTPKMNIQIIDVTLCLKGIKVSALSLMDTGNLLMDPALGLPIILVSKTLAYELYDGMKKKEPFFDVSLKSVSTEGYIKGIKLDYLKIYKNKTKYDCVMGVMEKDLKDEFKCILNPNHFI